MSKKKIRVLSLFDGISCARVALDRLGIVPEYLASEIDSNAMRVSARNWPDIVQLGDVKSLDGEKIRGGGLHLLIGGSPCQDLSRAKHGREGLKGSRSSLFYEYLRILKESKPKYFVLENVASMPKEARDEISGHLGVQPIMIDAGLVSAQSRKRYFWTNIPGICQPWDRGILLKDVLEEDIELTPLEMKIFGRIKGWREDDSHVWAFSRNESQSQITEHVYHKGDSKTHTLTRRGNLKYYQEGLLRKMRGGKVAVHEATKKGYAIAVEGDSIDISFPNSTTRRGRVGKKAKNLMTTSHISVLHKGYVRPLTPVECERLQSLPDRYTEGLSNAQRIETLGNAFNAEVVRHILQHADFL